MKDNPTDELRDLSPFLADLKQKTKPFEAPEGYFADLEQKIIAQVQDDSGSKTLSTSTPSPRFTPTIWRRTVAVAASLVLFGAVAYWATKPNPIVVAAQSESQEVELESYVLANLEEFEPSVFLEFLDSEASIDGEAAPLFTPEDSEGLLDDMSDAELEQLL